MELPPPFIDVTIAVRFLENEGEVFVSADIEKSGILGKRRPRRAGLSACACVRICCVLCSSAEQPALCRSICGARRVL